MPAPADHQKHLSLSSLWHLGDQPNNNSYALTLINNSNMSWSNRSGQGFKLCFCGPSRLSRQATVKGGKLVKQLSNYAEIVPDDGFELKPGGSWQILISGLDNHYQHWSDGLTSAFLETHDGTIQQILVNPARKAGDNQPLRRGTAKLDLPPSLDIPLSLTPWPNQVKVSGRRAPPQGFYLESEAAPAQQAAASFSDISQHLFPAEAFLRQPAEGGEPLACKLDPSLGSEAYRLSFAPTKITLSAATATGFLYGLISLCQIWRGAKREAELFIFPESGEILDQPDKAFRGCHLDVARQFYSMAEISQFLRIMAWNKLNIFHWHISDDEAFRIAIPAYPELAEKAAWRGSHELLPPLLGSGPARNGGFYNSDMVSAVVAQAMSYGMTVIPEIDVPGHCYAALQALPWLKDPDETGSYYSIQQFPNNCLNPAREESYRFVETVLEELIKLFPSNIIHLGADEVPDDAWEGSPQAKALLQQLGKTSAADLQSHFLKRLQAFLNKRQIKTAAWEEAALGGGIAAENCYLVGWRDPHISQKLADQGYDIVVSPGQHFYLDMSQDKLWAEPGASWAGYSSPQSTYDFDPIAGWSEEQKKHFLGVQACIWSEAMTDRAVFDRLVFPRLSAIAETGWTKRENKSWPRFAAASTLMPNLYGYWEK